MRINRFSDPRRPMPTQELKARFIEPMLLQQVQSLPEGPNWAYEVKLDGYRALAIKTNGKVLLRSRNNKDFNAKYPGIVTALGALPDETVIDGEVVALDHTWPPIVQCATESRCVQGGGGGLFRFRHCDLRWGERHARATFGAS